MPDEPIDFSPAHVAVITVSDTRTRETDKSGQLIYDQLVAARHDVVARRIVPDDLAEIQNAAKGLMNSGACDVIILTGGTGLAERDVTPEAIEPLIDKAIPGFGELFRALSYEEIGSSTIQSRVGAGFAGRTLVFYLPGSTGACRLGMEKIILPQIDNTHKPCNFREVMPASLERTLA